MVGVWRCPKEEEEEEEEGWKWGARGLVLGGGRHLTLGTGSSEPGHEVAPTLSHRSQEASKSIWGLKAFMIAKQKLPILVTIQNPS